MELLEERVRLDIEVLDVIRHIIERNVEKGLLYQLRSLHRIFKRPDFLHLVVLLQILYIIEILDFTQKLSTGQCINIFFRI